MLAELGARLAPVPAGALARPEVTTALLLALVLGVVVVAVDPVWRVARLGVTLVHELGHAGVGLLCGRRFTGFVLRGDMSGEAVTRGPARGAGRVLTTAAGYPAPAVVALVLVAAAARGWAAAVLGAVVAALVVALVRVRSALTLAVVLAVLAGAASLWWWRDDVRQAQVLTGLGLVLLVGAWRHLAAVRPRATPSLRRRERGDRGSDPAVLAELTHVPAPVWWAVLVLVTAGCTLGVLVTLRPLVTSSP
ncbi:M50 family metallopeptidase [Lapillicoccus jejuensis]|uniref:Peptidase M50B-like protein n=1 Tax=Lapillicoccus jejuensis TaxID=402171 RepID=A0A542DYT7_9MICO|nr:M50 family metallopeptidase [Lapillicoccus jejuensis]TQJ08260.1 peptidase M50B-like protein [Lapillicoccus jejuensis]